MTSSKKSDLSHGWPEASQFKRSIKLEFSLYMSGIILALMLVTGYVITDQYVKTVTQNVIDKLLVQARSYSGPAGKLIISTDEPDALLLNNICRRLTDDNSEVYWVGIADKQNVFIAHTDIKQVISSGQMRPIENSGPRTNLRDGESIGLGRDTIRITVPIEENNIPVGKLRVASSAEPIAAARHTSIMTVASITILALLIGLPIATIVFRRKLQPISMITDGLKNVDFKDITLDISVETNNEFGYLARTLKVMGAKLKVAQQDIIVKERIERELEIAREIQANILPLEYPRTASFEFSGTYRSAREVGGDYYDFIEIDEDHLGFLVADVSGKSLPGMLVMLLTRDIVLRLARTITQPADLLTEVNRELLLSIKKGMFVTMFYGVLDKRTGHFIFASAGHNPLIRLKGRAGEPELIKTKGYPLGMMSEYPFRKRIETGQISLSDNDWIIQYTDGINEAQNSAGEEFGMDRFVHLLESHKSLNPKGLAGATIGYHEAFMESTPQYDDITLLVMKWNGKTADIKTAKTGAADIAY